MSGETGVFKMYTAGVGSPDWHGLVLRLLNDYTLTPGNDGSASIPFDSVVLDTDGFLTPGHNFGGGSYIVGAGQGGDSIFAGIYIASATISVESSGAVTNPFLVTGAIEIDDDLAGPISYTTLTAAPDSGNLGAGTIGLAQFGYDLAVGKCISCYAINNSTTDTIKVTAKNSNLTIQYIGT